MGIDSPPKEVKETVPTPEYWKENIPFKSPKKFFELQFSFAKLMADRRGLSLLDSVLQYAPVIRNATHVLDENRSVGELLPGVTDKNMLESAWETSVVRNEIENTKPTLYHQEGGSRFGCMYYDYDTPPTINIHFFNAEFEEEWEDGKDVSKGPLDASKTERRMHELADMFRDIKARHPDATEVSLKSWLCNIPAFMRLFPETFSAGDIEYDPKLWEQGQTIWGQFLGGTEKVTGQYGFKEKVAEEFIKNVQTAPVEILADALPYPPRVAKAPIADFYKKYGIA